MQNNLEVRPSLLSSSESQSSTSTMWQSVSHKCPTAANVQANCTTRRQNTMRGNTENMQHCWPDHADPTKLNHYQSKVWKEKSESNQADLSSSFKCAAKAHQKINQREIVFSRDYIKTKLKRSTRQKETKQQIFLFFFKGFNGPVMDWSL